jgi:hypothetical protein
MKLFDTVVCFFDFQRMREGPSMEKTVTGFLDSGHAAWSESVTAESSRSELEGKIGHFPR